MNTFSIQFIERPSFVVDFNQFLVKEEVSENLTTLQKGEKVAYEALRLVGLFFNSLKDGAVITFSQSWVSFKHIVLNHYGAISANYRPPADIYLVAFKIVFWVLGMSYCLLSTSTRLFLKKIQENQNSALLKAYNEEINMDHIKTNELILDASHVPNDITVDQLATILEEINFDNQDLPGYMKETTRQEGTTIYTVDELKSRLQTFINRVKKREPFLGTPPAYDTPRLMAFYEQIENAVRLSIFKSNQELKQFIAENGSDSSTYNDATKTKHRDLLETRARIALDLGIAGEHCGARYMGDVMTIYYGLYESNLLQGSLSDTLIELLAQKRKEIALGQIETYLGSNTHGFTNYMGSFGEILGIPGTKNVIEHLSNPLDQGWFLGRFFKEYTVEVIIDCIQEKVKTSQGFREKIIDFVKTKANDWKKDEYQARVPALVRQITEVINDKGESRGSSHSHIENFKALICDLKEKIHFPEWNEDFWEELFALDAAKDWAVRVFGNVQMERITKMNALKTFLMKGKQDELQQFIFEDKPLGQLDNQEKVTKIRKILNLEEDTIIRILENKTDLKTAVEDMQDQNRRLEFIEHFQFENMDINGMSKELMEWLLVSHDILSPQLERTIQNHTGINRAAQTDYVNQVYQGFIEKKEREIQDINFNRKQFLRFFEKSISSEVMEESATKILADAKWVNLSKRYQFNATTKRDQLLRTVFDESYLYDPEKIDVLTEKMVSTEARFYSRLKKVVVIDAPSLAGKILGNRILKVALGIYGFMKGYEYLAIIYEATEFVLTAKIVPLMINHLPVEAIKTINLTAAVKDAIFALLYKINNNIFSALIICYVAKRIIIALNIPYLSKRAEELDLLSLVRRVIYVVPQTLGEFFLVRAYAAAYFLPNLCTTASGFFQNLSEQAEKERQNMIQQKAINTWRIITQETAPQVLA